MKSYIYTHVHMQQFGSYGLYTSCCENQPITIVGFVDSEETTTY
jgi:hypothetical protein